MKKLHLIMYLHSTLLYSSKQHEWAVKELMEEENGSNVLAPIQRLYRETMTDAMIAFHYPARAVKRPTVMDVTEEIVREKVQECHAEVVITMMKKAQADYQAYVEKLERDVAIQEVDGQYKRLLTTFRWLLIEPIQGM